MIKIFDYQNGEIKIMYNESPIIKDYKYDWKKHQVEIITFPISLNYQLGVELKISKGGRICYGMLGVQVEPNEEINCVKIDIAFTQGNSIRYYDSCLYNDNKVYKGLPEEYVEPVIQKAISEILKKDKYPQYKVIFEYAANCEVGSSPMIYELITEIIINMISKNTCEKIIDMDIEAFTEQFAKNTNLHY
ncbi:MAG: hypothetical protein HFG52_16065 [Lachnospiraceae bacterium]|nr:hypothetical protein [Lachnospiraceae bacterium]